jgi:hypothetical protein
MVNSSVVPLEYVLRALLELHSSQRLEHMRDLLLAALHTLTYREKVLSAYCRYVPVLCVIVLLIFHIMKGHTCQNLCSERLTCKLCTCDCGHAVHAEPDKYKVLNHAMACTYMYAIHVHTFTHAQIHHTNIHTSYHMRVYTCIRAYMHTYRMVEKDCAAVSRDRAALAMKPAAIRPVVGATATATADDSDAEQIRRCVQLTCSATGSDFCFLFRQTVAGCLV